MLQKNEYFPLGCFRSFVCGREKLIRKKNNTDDNKRNRGYQG